MHPSQSCDEALLGRLWRALGGPEPLLPLVSFSGPLRGLASVYEVSALASASIAAASLAVAELHAARHASAAPRVHVERLHADAAFQSERHLAALGFALPAVWDPLAGDYRARDGFIRLHTNYTHHRDAVLRALQVGPSRDEVARAVASWDAEALEGAVVEQGGAAARMRSPAEFREHAQARALSREALVQRELSAGRAAWSEIARPAAPLSGVRVLDLTRVIAGPIGTRFLAGYGADVLRIDPPGFEEVGALLFEVTAGKRRAALDLRGEAGRRAFEALVAKADVIVHGYRPAALEELGFGNARLRALNPAAVLVCHDAYGWAGPWAGRRGFDSLVQMSCGIAFRGMEATSSDRPLPLPAQALDHATGYLIAAAVCRALTHQLTHAETSVSRLSLARTAQLLMELGDLGSVQGLAPSAQAAAPYLEEADTAFGRVRRVRSPGRIEGVLAAWRIPAGPLGVDPARFSERQ